MHRPGGRGGPATMAACYNSTAVIFIHGSGKGTSAVSARKGPGGTKIPLSATRLLH